MNKQLAYGTLGKLGLASAQITGDTNGVIIDTKGYGEICYYLLVAAIATADGDNYFTPRIYESDASDMAGAVEITGDRLLGTVPVFNSTGKADNVYQLGARVGTKRYIRLTMDETSTADMTLGAVAVLGSPMDAPTSPPT